MPRKVLLITFLAAIAMIVSPVWAQSTPAQSLSLQECIDIALKNQTDVLIARNSVDAAKARVAREKGAYFPQVTAQYSNAIVQSRVTQFGQAGDGTSVGVNQNFYDGGLREARIRGAGANASQSAYSLERTRQTVAFTVTSDYFSVLRSQKLAGVSDAQVKYLEGQLELIRARVNLGDAAPVDTLPIEAQLANARVDQLAANNTVRTSAIQLQNTMGLSATPNFSVQDVTEPTDIKLLTVDDYLETALTARPEVKETEFGVKVAKASTQQAKIVLYPRPVVNGQYNEFISGNSENTYEITAGLAFDLFNGGSNRAAYKEAQANLSSAELRAAQISKDIYADVQNAYFNLTNSKERLTASELSLAAARKNLEAQGARYKSGLAIPLDLLNAQTQVVTAESNAVQSRYDYYTSVAQLEYAIGKQEGLNGK